MERHMERKDTLSASSKKEQDAIIQSALTDAEATFKRCNNREYSKDEKRLVTSLLNQNIDVLKKITIANNDAKQYPSDQNKATKASQLNMVREEMIRSINHAIKPKSQENYKDKFKECISNIKSKKSTEERPPRGLKK